MRVLAGEPVEQWTLGETMAAESISGVCGGPLFEGQRIKSPLCNLKKKRFKMHNSRNTIFPYKFSKIK